MLGNNTTGAASPNFYFKGVGTLFFREVSGATDSPIGGFRILGNAPEFNLTGEAELLTHNSSMEAGRPQDASLVKSKSNSGTLKLEEFNDENMALFFWGQTEVVTNGAGAAITDAVLVEDGQIQVGGMYPLKTATGAPVKGIPTATAVTLATTEIVPVTLVEGTDYTIDKAQGYVVLLDTPAITTAIGTNDGITFSVPLIATPKAISGVTLNARNKIVGEILFNGLNDQSGERFEIFFPKVSLTPDGDIPMIGEEWSNIPLKMTVEKSANSEYAAYPYGRTLKVAQ